VAAPHAVADHLELVHPPRLVDWPEAATLRVRAAAQDGVATSVSVIRIEPRRLRFRRAGEHRTSSDSVVRALRARLGRDEHIVALDGSTVAVLFVGRGLDDAFSRVDDLRFAVARDARLSATVAAVRDAEPLAAATERAHLKLMRFAARGVSALAV
jgi:hypothetical protein